MVIGVFIGTLRAPHCTSDTQTNTLTHGLPWQVSYCSPIGRLSWCARNAIHSAPLFDSPSMLNGIAHKHMPANGVINMGITSLNTDCSGSSPSPIGCLPRCGRVERCWRHRSRRHRLSDAVGAVGQHVAVVAEATSAVGHHVAVAAETDGAVGWHVAAAVDAVG